jgi:branched-chain amino acid transport system substrate-binding protein
VKRVLFAAAALVATMAVGLQGAFAQPERAAGSDPGINSRTITIGGTFPLSGPASLYAPIPAGMRAYFSFINSRKGPDGKRGVYGRQIVWKFYDDQYNPSMTVQLTNQLILRDRVFALVGSLGTEHNLAIRNLVNQRRVPHVMVSTGASYWGLQANRYPYTTGWQPDYITEGIAYGRWIVQNAPNAKIAIFYQNDDYGKDYLRGVKIGLGRRTNLIVSELGYEITDTSYGSQIARQRASGADTWILLTTPTPTVRAIATARALNWRPDTIVINSVSAVDTVMQAAAQNAGPAFVNGAVSTAYLKNPTNPAYASDAAVRQYRRIMERWGGDANPNNTFYYYGVAKAYDFVRALYAAGRNPTRASLLRAIKKMNWVNPFAIRGITVTTSRRDAFPLSQVKLIRYQNGSWTEFGGLIRGRK